MTREEFQNIAPGLPAQPGIYKYYDANGQLLYVGKAKNLRKRVSSYFLKHFPGYKTYELVKRIARIEYTVVNSEQDAFLLENNLIKQFQPKFNINLKDDKSYPYIVIRNEPFPRVYLTRNKTEDGSYYFGPYTSVKKVRELLDFIRQTIPLRSCKLRLTENNIKRGKFKVCLEYHLGNCKGPCAGLQNAEDYEKNIQQVKNLLRGNLSGVIRHFTEEMKAYAKQLAFEKAESIKKKIEFLKNYQSKSVVISHKKNNVDVFAVQQKEQVACIHYMMIRNGIIIQTHNTRAETHLNETPQEILMHGISRLRETFQSDVKEIIVPFSMEYPDKNVKLIVPVKGEFKNLLSLCEKNAQIGLEEMQNRNRLLLDAKKDFSDKLPERLQKELSLKNRPLHIECFDNSHLQGSFPVSALVCFKNGEPDKNQYRLFHMRTSKKGDDFAFMREAISRRYKRLLQENKPLPDLIIIDGGKGQLHAAVQVIDELELNAKPDMIALAKKEEEVFLPGRKEPLRLAMNSEALKFLRKIRNEAHRFVLKFHRKSRNAGLPETELAQIKGIGKQTALLLLNTYRSVKGLKDFLQNKNAGDELARLIGKKKTELVMSHFSEPE
ncbi:MAG: excinuclease ABC subunit UvrC [Chitinophagaceae bacterium]|nr:excinuclease ABC subunit UvrC [Chitinophagaceae bacterium]